jgi:superfamily II DNA/RNA helicase
MPESTDDYIHRIGCTGRVEKNGDALTFVTGADADKILALERILDAPLERLALKDFDYAKPVPDKELRLSYRQGRRVVRRREIGEPYTRYQPYRI